MEKLLSCAYRRARLGSRNSCRNSAGDILCAKCVTAYEHVSSSRAAQAGRCPDVVTADSCYSVRLSVRTLVQSVAEGHPGQLHLGPRVVQYLPAPLQGAEDAIVLQLRSGTYIQPGMIKIMSAVQPRCLTQAEAVPSSGKSMELKYVSANALLAMSQNSLTVCFIL